MHIYNMIMGLFPTRGASAPTRLKTKSAHACKALLMGCDLVYVTSGFKTPTIYKKSPTWHTCAKKTSRERHRHSAVIFAYA